MFTCDEEVLQRHDSTFTDIGDTKDVNPEVLHSVRNFIEANWTDCNSVEVNEDVKESLTADTPMISSSDVPSNVEKLLQLKRIGDGIREQCKMITDLSYNMEDAQSGEVILSHLCDVYSYFYSQCQDHKGIVHIRKDHLKFKTLTGKRRNKGFFRRGRIVPCTKPEREIPKYQNLAKELNIQGQHRRKCRQQHRKIGLRLQPQMNLHLRVHQYQ